MHHNEILDPCKNAVIWGQLSSPAPPKNYNNTIAQGKVIEAHTCCHVTLVTLAGCARADSIEQHCSASQVCESAVHCVRVHVCVCVMVGPRMFRGRLDELTGHSDVACIESERTCCAYVPGVGVHTSGVQQEPRSCGHRRAD